MGKLVSKTSKRNSYSPKIETVCCMCGKSYLANSGRQKTCIEQCSREYSSAKQRERYRKNYKPKGYNQSGENNNVHKKLPGNNRKNWQYSKYRKDYCEHCKRTELQTKLTFVVHHIDGNPTNNVCSNLITLCHSCHKFVHRGKIILNKV